MINESQKCCSGYIVSGTGLQSRSENETTGYLQAISPEAGSSSLLSSSPEVAGEDGGVTVIILWHVSKTPVGRGIQAAQLFAHRCP